MRTFLETLFIVAVIAAFFIILGLANAIADTYPGFIAGVAFSVMFAGLIWGFVLCKRMVD